MNINYAKLTLLLDWVMLNYTVRLHVGAGCKTALKIMHLSTRDVGVNTIRT